MGLLNTGTAENLIVLMAGVLLYNSAVNLPTVGEYFQKYPLILIIIAIALLVFKDKISKTIGG